MLLIRRHGDVNLKATWEEVFFTFVAAAVDGFGEPLALIHMQLQAVDLGAGRTEAGFQRAVLICISYGVLRGVSKCIAALLALDFMVRCNGRSCREIRLDPGWCGAMPKPMLPQMRLSVYETVGGRVNPIEMSSVQFDN